MYPRILLRTHYEADEPRLIIGVVTSGGSHPTESRSEDRVAAALANWAKVRGYTISTPGAIYAVGNARHLGIINRSNRWDHAGLAFAFLDSMSSTQNEQDSRLLSVPEASLYLGTYIHGAGALLVKFAAWLLERGKTSDEELRDKSIIELLLVGTFDDYLEMATEARDRSAIRRERDRLKQVNYAASTKRHKRYPLLTTMRRLDLITVDENGTVRPDSGGRLAALGSVLPTIEVLERAIRKGVLRDMIARAMPEGENLSRAEAHQVLARAYQYAMGLGLQACSLSFLDDVLVTLFPATLAQESVKAKQLLDPMHQERPGEIRFHVDRRGDRAFVVLNEATLNSLLS